MASPPSHPRNQPPPSIRTFSNGSTLIQSSSLSPTSTLASTSSSGGPTGLGIYSARTSSSTSSSSPTSPTTSTAERNFFGALVQKARDRSRSRSRSRVHRSRSRSPMPPARRHPQQQSTYEYYTQQPVTRPSIMPLSPSSHHRHHHHAHEPRRLESRSSTSSSEDFYYGRHANQWLFGNFSFRETVRDVCSKSLADKGRK